MQSYDFEILISRCMGTFINHVGLEGEGFLSKVHISSFFNKKGAKI